jgi:hypothetical protein
MAINIGESGRKSANGRICGEETGNMAAIGGVKMK